MSVVPNQYNTEDRKHVVALRFTVDEDANLRAYARAAGRTVSQVIRDRLADILTGGRRRRPAKNVTGSGSASE